MKRLEGKIAIVTGGGSTPRGIGRVTAETLAREGAKVVVHDLNAEGAQATVESIVAAGGEAIAVTGDISKREDMANVVAKAIEAYGRVDILANVAGITEPRSTFVMTNDQWNRIMAVDLEGTFNIIREVLPHMAEQKYGKIIAISSEVGKRGGGIFGGSHYAAAKAGVLGFIKSVAREAGKYNICVNAICPGLIETDIHKGMTDERREELRREVLLERWGHAEDIANAVLFLASEESSYITGEALDVNGGHYID